MGKVILDMAMSLDGFIAGPNDEDMGLHDYFFSPSNETAAVVEQGIKTTGTIIMGRRSYDIGAAQNGFADNPYQVPKFILSHTIPQSVPNGAETFIFVTDGIDSLIQQAKISAGDKDVVIGGGSNTAQQFLKHGYVDEIQIHLVPRLIGKGIRLFDFMDDIHIKLERINVIDAPDVTHLSFSIFK